MLLFSLFASSSVFSFFFFYPSLAHLYLHSFPTRRSSDLGVRPAAGPVRRGPPRPARPVDRKSTRLNSSHVAISYAVFCLKKKKNSMIKRQKQIIRYNPLKH